MSGLRRSRVACGIIPPQGLGVRASGTERGAGLRGDRGTCASSSRSASASCPPFFWLQVSLGLADAPPLQLPEARPFVPGALRSSPLAPGLWSRTVTTRTAPSITHQEQTDMKVKIVSSCSPSPKSIPGKEPL